MIFEDSCQSRSWMDRSLHLANEKGLETARTVVPLQSLAIPIPQLEAVFFLAVLVSVTKRIVDSCFALSPHSIEHFISREKQCFSVNDRASGVYAPEIIRLADIPILESDGSAIGHPEESTFFGLVRARGPKVLVSETEILDVFLQSVVFLLRRYARQVHPVISAILGRSVPIGLETR